jgi:hypothetical protein
LGVALAEAALALRVAARDAWSRTAEGALVSGQRESELMRWKS